MARMHLRNFWLILFFCVVFCLSGVLVQRLEPDNEDIIEKGRDVINNLYQRFPGKEVDLVFILDRSASIPHQGWSSMITFIRSILEHFSVTGEHTRVAVITYGSHVSLEINDLNEKHTTKCSLMKQIKQRLEKKVMAGYTATYDALKRAQSILLNSRRNAKKAVFVLTDGKSNVGPNPVRASLEIRALRWNSKWNSTAHGPQVEIYASGIKDANIPELESIASKLNNHTFYIPDFKTFSLLARNLHNNSQKEIWEVANRNFCKEKCSKNAVCSCGTRVGQYQCICNAGYEGDGITCKLCPKGFFKRSLSPGKCQPCPHNSTTFKEGAEIITECICHPAYYRESPNDICKLHHCEKLKDIEHGYSFHVEGAIKDEVPNTNIACKNTPKDSCHYQCDVGYRLDSNPVLICEPNGTWSGTVPKCKVVDCKTLIDIGEGVENGYTEYPNKTTTYGSYVSVHCQSGWQAFGDKMRKCNSHGVWDGTRVWCVEAKCKPLPSFKGGSLKPQECYERNSKPGVICRYTCKEGYNLIGPPQKKCGNHGEWNDTTETECIDVEPPKLKCPADVTIATRNQGYAIVHLNNEKVLRTDNSDYVLLTHTGPIESAARFTLGFHQIEYTASDRAGNSVSCVQRITVQKETIKLESCPSSINITIGSEFQVAVTWPDPVFLDKNGKPVEYYCSHPNGSKFIVGLYNNICAPKKDYGQDVKCIFSITIGRKTCEPPDPPINGGISCSSHHSLYLQMCMAHCNGSYDFVELPEEQYTCDLDGKWNTEIWPDCSSVHIPGAAAMQGMLEYYYFTGDCDKSRDQIRGMFHSKLAGQINKYCSKAKCTVKDIDVICHKNQERKRRDTSHALYKRDRQILVAQFLRIQFKIVGLIQKSNVTAKDQFQLRRTLGLINLEIKKLDNLNITSNVSNLIGDLSVANYSSGNIEILANCGDKNMVTVQSSSTKKCLNCPVGHFYKNNGCEPCPIGEYQDREGKKSCVKCPKGTSTIKTKSKLKTDCRDFCRPGTYSSNGFSPCQPCELSTYQENYNATSCQKCPGSLITTTFGSSHQSDCSTPCPPGSYNNRTGLKPCVLCPISTYQPNNKSRECFSCPLDSKSQQMGATSIHQCLYKDHCQTDAASSPICMNNGRCRNNYNNFTCECLDGYEGKQCEINIDECLTNECYNGGTCIDGIFAFTCKCRPGYTGHQCEQELNECDSSPCQNKGSCEDQLNGFKCYCPQQYTGKYCETEFTYCRSSPCSHHGVCEHLGHTFRCHCDPGFTGRHCNLTIDRCRSHQCFNGGSCKSPLNFPVCDCLPGFSGAQCENEINECDFHRCKHGGKCFDLFNDYHCSCIDGYAGKNCEEEVNPNFDLVFKHETITDYAQVWFFPNPEAITITFWMRTSDVSSLGTMVSYKKESNHIFNPDNFALYDYGSLQLCVNGEKAIIGISLNNGMWQHVSVTWTSKKGKWQLYLNGTRTASGKGLAAGTTLPVGGKLFIGQDANVQYGAANVFEGYIGEITQMNVYNEVLNDSEVKDIANQETCNQKFGNVLTWSELAGNVKGSVSIRRNSWCLDINECLFPEVFHCTKHMFCNDTLNDYECVSCIYGYEGPKCDKSIDECRLGVCLNGASCTDGPGPYDYVCSCTSNFRGRTCANELKDCTGVNLCRPHERCVTDGNEQYCQKSGHDAPDSPTIDCSRENPCKNGGTCMSDTNPNRCKCTSEWKGTYCDVIFQPTCKLSPCLNGGTCVTQQYNQGYKCICPKLINNSVVNLDENCAFQNPCDSYPCQNNGICLNSKEDGFKCECADNFHGKYCQLTTSTLTQECDDNTCHNSGTCVKDNSTALHCKCTLPYTGKLCEIKRKQAKKAYIVTVELQYLFSETSNPKFSTYFTNQVKSLYQNILKNVDIQVNIKSRKPSISFNYTEVQFEMILIEYKNPGDNEPVTNTYTIRRIIEDSLHRNKLGDFKASLRQFKFEEVTDRMVRSSTVFYVLLAIFIIAIVAVGVVIYFRKFRRREPPTLNSGQNNWNEMQHTANPAYSPTLVRRPPPPIPLEDNHYAELSDVVPNYMKNSPLEIKIPDDDTPSSVGKISPLTKNWPWINEEADKESKDTTQFKLQDGVSNRAYDAGDYMVPVSEPTAEEKEVEDDVEVHYEYEKQPQYLELDDAGNKSKVPDELKPTLPKLDDDLPPPSPPALPPPPPHELRPLQPSPVARPRARSPAHSAMLSQRKLPPLPTRRKRH